MTLPFNQTFENDTFINSSFTKGINTSWSKNDTNCTLKVNTRSMYLASKLIFFLGVVANAVVISRVFFDKRIRSLTFIVIACLAFSDMVYLLLNTVELVDIFVRLSLCIRRNSLSWSSKWTSTVGAAWFAANFHIPFISFVRFIILVYPLKAPVILSYRKIILCSACIWIIGGVTFGVFESIREMLHIKPQTSSYVYVPLWIVVYVVSVTITIVLHLFKMHLVHKTAQVASHIVTQKLLLRMARVILVVIVFAITLPLPKFIVGGLSFYGIRCGVTICDVHLRQVSNILFMVNHCINPFIYAFMSPEFRKSLKRMVSFASVSGNEDSSVSSNLNTVSSRI